MLENQAEDLDIYIFKFRFFSKKPHFVLKDLPLEITTKVNNILSTVERTSGPPFWRSDQGRNLPEGHAFKSGRNTYLYVHV